MNNSHNLIYQTDKIISIASSEKVNIPLLQQELYKLYSQFNKPNGGKLITSFPQKDKLCECFIFMLKYDWIKESDIREVWAEDGFYCIIKCIRQSTSIEEQARYFMDLFMLLRYGRFDLKTKIQDILNKAQILGNPVFDTRDYDKGAQYVIDQFSFLTINGIRPIAQNNINIIIGFMAACDGQQYFDEARKLNFYNYSPNRIFDKAKFIASVIESILNDM